MDRAGTQSYKSVWDEKDAKEAEQSLRELLGHIRERWQKGHLAQTEKRLQEIADLTADNGFWQDPSQAQKVLTEEKRLKASYKPWKNLLTRTEENLELLIMAREEGDEETLQETMSEGARIEKEFDRVESLSLLDQEDDHSNCYLTIHPGAGGTESQDWAEMLMRMYLRWAENNGIKVQILDNTPGEQAGVKSFTAHLVGETVYGLLKSENGVHRLVRISPFDSQKRRHTSFASVYITPEVDDKIEIEINDVDLRVDTFRSSGAGGQHVNTTDSAVRITHIPTGVVVQCQNERSQHKNRVQAMKMLRSSLYQMEKERQEAEHRAQQFEKKEIAWGNQIRSYVFHPYNMVKDHRTNHETGNSQAVISGEILDEFIYAYLKAKSLRQL